jgi:NADH dehydrogenase [ubiquinone] 1 alpha subcomplex assembly factor 7
LPDAGPAARRLARTIVQGGPVPVSLFMAIANAHYYATRDSQMFGELIGLWCADLWLRAGAPADAAWVEIGGGRGTLAGDALRAMARFDFAPDVHMVDASPVLRDLQAVRVPHARFHDDISSLPNDRPLIIIANELFDCLPVRQLVLTPDGWRERLVDVRGSGFVATIGDVPMTAAVPEPLRAAPTGTILETSPASVAIAGDLAATLVRQGGALLVIDYGYEGPAHGDTVQAVRAHGVSDIFAHVGEQDVTAHVDFGSLAAVARGAGACVLGPVGQGALLEALGLTSRADALMDQHPARSDAIATERNRLSAADQMGTLFKAMAVTAPAWPAPEGFAM